MMMYWIRIVLVGVVMLLTTLSYGHEVRPARLVIQQKTDSTYHISWKLPTIKEGVLRLSPDFKANHDVVDNDRPRDLGDAYVTAWTIQPYESLEGSEVVIQGLENTITDVFVTVKLINGNEDSFLIRPANPKFQILSNRTEIEVIKEYVILGVEHIWMGYDHLLFVLCLVWLITGFKKLIKTITAFTIAHSITLGVSVLGWISLPSAPVEAVIALSILFLAIEIVQKLNNSNNKSFTAKHPWLVALIFGLLHGFGFAGALTEVGLPNNAIPIALLGFNLGVEIGQVIFIIAIISLMYLLNKLIKNMPSLLPHIAIYAIGSLASFWLIERVSGFI